MEQEHKFYEKLDEAIHNVLINRTKDIIAKVIDSTYQGEAEEQCFLVQRSTSQVWNLNSKRATRIKTKWLAKHRLAYHSLFHGITAVPEE